MSGFFARLASTVTSAVSDAVAKVAEVTADFSLDALQDEYGDPSGLKQLYGGLDYTYLTPRIIAMGFPSSPSSKIRSRNDIRAVSSLLLSSHSGHFLVWSAAEENLDGNYDNNTEFATECAAFTQQIIELNFPGYPAPPLGLLFKICTSIENWLAADKDNVAVIFCMTGKGRTSVISACALAWLGEFDSPITALDYVIERRCQTWQTYTPDIAKGVEAHCTPSQIRYVQYFAHVLDGVKPRSSASVLRRVIMNGIPDFVQPEEDESEAMVGEGGAVEGAEKVLNEALHVVGKAAVTAKKALRGDYIGEGVNAAADETPTPHQIAAKKLEAGCRPYLQVFKGSKLLFSSTWNREGRKADSAHGDDDVPAENDLRWYEPEDGSVRFGDIDIPVSGDILVRCRHYGDKGDRQTIWRSAFHTGYVHDHVLRLSKHHLDVATHDPRFLSDFWVELVFAPVTVENETAAAVSPDTDGGKREPLGLEGTVTVKAADAADYESALEAESSLWMDINARKLARSVSGGSGAASGLPRSGTGPSLDEVITQLAKKGGSQKHAQPKQQPKATAPSVRTDLSAPMPSITSRTPESTAAPPKTSPAGSSVELDKDIAELEELTRELGLGHAGEAEAQTSSEPSQASAPAPVDSSNAHNDEIEDLEKYLNSLS